jgi:energy-coupling factor transporter transmembrane protein EcfT
MQDLNRAIRELLSVNKYLQAMGEDSKPTDSHEIILLKNPPDVKNFRFIVIILSFTLFLMLLVFLIRIFIIQSWNPVPFVVAGFFIALSIWGLVTKYLDDFEYCPREIQIETQGFWFRTKKGPYYFHWDEVRGFCISEEEEGGILHRFLGKRGYVFTTRRTFVLSRPNTKILIEHFWRETGKKPIVYEGVEPPKSFQNYKRKS